jgi:hypothetical protein
MRKQILLLCCAFGLAKAPKPKGGKPVALRNYTALFDWKYPEMKVSDEELEAWIGKPVIGVLFITKYNKRGLKTDHVRLNAFVYDDAGKVKRLKLSVLDNDAEIEVPETKIFSSYGMSAEDFKEMVDFVKNHNEVEGFRFTPRQKTVTGADGEPLYTIEYDVTPIGASLESFLTENKRTVAL